MRKMAILILAHQSPEILRKLVHALDNLHFDIFIHVDAKSDIASFQFGKYSLHESRLHILPKRINVGWGDISMVDAMMELYRYAIGCGEYERFIMLSGEDYPIQSNLAIFEALSKADVEFIQTFENSNEILYTAYWIGRRYSRYFCVALRRVLWSLGIRKKPYILVRGEKWEIAGSSQWHALSRACVKHILHIYDQNPCIRTYFKYSFPPDSMLIPTIIKNSPEFRDKVFPTSDSDMMDFNKRPVIHYLNRKPTKGSSVEIFDETAYERIIASNKLFVRKVRSGISDQLIEMLDQRRNEQNALRE